MSGRSACATFVVRGALLAFLASASGPAPSGARASPARSLQGSAGLAAPRAVHFQDYDLRNASVGGVVSIRGVGAGMGVTEYRVRWGSDGSTSLGDIGTVSSAVIAPLPNCTGPSCGSITVSRASGGNITVSRGSSGYGNNEEAVIRFEQRGTLHFSYFFTEDGYDLVRVHTGESTYELSGSLQPGAISNPLRLEWSSDTSIRKQGWVATFVPDGGSSSILYVQVPWGTVPPAGATHVLAYSASPSSEAPVPVSARLVDHYDVPKPRSLVFDDTNNNLRVVTGNITVGEAAQERLCYTTPHPNCTLFTFMVPPGLPGGQPVAGCLGEREVNQSFCTTTDTFNASSTNMRTCSTLCAQQGPDPAMAERYEIYWGTDNETRLGTCAARLAGFTFDDNFMPCSGDVNIFGTSGLFGELTSGYESPSKALVLDGTFRPLVSFIHDVHAPHGVTMMAYVKLMSAGEGPTQLMRLQNLYSPSDRVEMRISSVGRDAECVGSFRNGAFYERTCERFATSSMTTGVWAHVACVFGPRSESTFINGELASRCHTTVTQDDVYWLPNFQTVTLSLGGTQAFAIDEVFVHDEPFDEAHVEAFMPKRPIAIVSKENPSTGIAALAVPPLVTHLLAYAKMPGLGIDFATPASTEVADLATPTQGPQGVRFVDTNSASGVIGGVGAIRRATSEFDVTAYHVYWASSATQKIAGQDKVAMVRTSANSTNTTNQSAPVAGVWRPRPPLEPLADEIVFHISPVSTPSGATHLICVSAYNSAEMSTGVSIELQDYSPPSAIAGGVAFEDTDPGFMMVGGVVTITAASDESAVTQYNVYWADSFGTAGGMLGSVRTGNALTMTVSSRPIPQGAHSLIVYTQGSGGENRTGVSVVVQDRFDGELPQALAFEDTNAMAMAITGEIRLERAIDESTLEAYEIWYGDNTNRLGTQPVLVIQTGTTQVYMVMKDSYGDGWHGGTFRIEDSSGQLLATGTLRDGAYERVALNNIQFGLDYFVRIHPTEWASEISWEVTQCSETDSSSNETCTVLTSGRAQEVGVFQGAGSGSSVTRLLNISTSHLPNGTTHLMAYGKKRGDSSLTSSARSTPLVDWSPPTVVARGAAFNDSNASARMIAGDLTFKAASPLTGISGYIVKWGWRPDPMEFCQDFNGWSDRNGNGCGSYVENRWCTPSGEHGPEWNEDQMGGSIPSLGNGTWSAFQACCGCGGGARPTGEEHCMDMPGFVDNGGNDCGRYRAGAWCTSTGQAGMGWNTVWGSLADRKYTTAGAEYTPLDACCVCGGGLSNRAIPPVPVQGANAQYFALYSGAASFMGDASLAGRQPSSSKVGQGANSLAIDSASVGALDADFVVRFMAHLQVRSEGYYSFVVNESMASLTVDGHHSPGMQTLFVYLVPGMANLSCAVARQRSAIQPTSIVLMYSGADTGGPMVPIPSDRLFYGMSDISTIANVTATGANATETVAIAAQRIPHGAGAFLIFSYGLADGETPYGRRLAFRDLVSVTEVVTNIKFDDLDPVANHKFGVLRFDVDMSETSTDAYAVFFGSDSTTPNLSLGVMVVHKRDILTTAVIPIDEVHPNATHLLVYAMYHDSMAASGASVALVDYSGFVANASAVRFEDVDTTSGEISGTVTITAAANESSVKSYKVYWGSGRMEKLTGGMPGLNGTGYFLAETPTALPTNLTQLVLNEVANEVNFSYPVAYLLAGPGASSAAGFAMHAHGILSIRQAGRYAFLLTTPNRFRITLNGEVLIHKDTVGRTTASVEVRMLASGAAEILVETAAARSEENLAAMLEYAGPDTDFQKVLVASPALRHGSVLNPLLGSVNKGGATVDVPANTPLLGNATHLLVLAVSTTDEESPSPVAVRLWDSGSTSGLAGGVRFNDTEPVCGVIGGALRIVRAADEASITHYNVYFGSSATTRLNIPSRLLSGRKLQAGGAPTCQGHSCNVIEIVGVDAGTWRISRLGTYNNDEYAIVTVHGPGTVAFAYLETEECCDFVTVAGTRVAGHGEVDIIEVPEGSVQIVWRSDYSVRHDGWSLVFQSRDDQFPVDSVNITDNAYIGSAAKFPFGVMPAVSIPVTTLPSGATHFLVYSADGTNELPTPLGAPISDFCPRQNWPRAIQFTDADPRFAMVGGRLVITPAQDETDVLSYVIFAGANATHKWWPTGSSTSPSEGELTTDGWKFLELPVGDTTVDVPHGFVIPSGLTHLHAYSRSASGLSLEFATTEIVDMGVPDARPSNLSFVDTHPGANTISGDLTFEGAANEADQRVTEYEVYWGSNATTRMLYQPRLASLSVRGGSAPGAATGLQCGHKGFDDTPIQVPGAAMASGEYKPYIVNGQTATPCEWRWQVSLRTESGFHFCGGTLISPKWVLTAAHCVQSPGPIKVVAGDFSRESGSDQHQTERLTSRVIAHPQYRTASDGFDIALLELSSEILPGECVAYACMPEDEIPDGAECYISGWGTLQSGGSSPDLLQEARVGIVGSADCGAAYGSNYNASTMVCAQGRSYSGVTDACQGDSGGPLVCQGSRGGFEVHGATSWGYGCADPAYPGIWARVTTFVDWVQNNTNNAGMFPRSALRHTFQNATVPSGASHLLVYAANNGSLALRPAAVEVVDFVPPSPPRSVSFTDSDATPREIAGRVTIMCATDQGRVDGYEVLWASASSTLGRVRQIRKCNAGEFNVSFEIPANTRIAPNATVLQARSYGRTGVSATSVTVRIQDHMADNLPGGVSFQDMDVGAGAVGGTVTIQSAATTDGLSAYRIYWGVGSACQKHDETPLGMVAVSSSSGAGPMCSGPSCSLIKIITYTRGSWVISRAAYTNGESARVELTGPGIITFNSFRTEPQYDRLVVLGTAFSGTSVPSSMVVPVGTHAVVWNSDASVTEQGWSFNFTVQHSAQNETLQVPMGTVIGQARSIVVKSVLASGVEAASCSECPLVDYAPPTEVPAAVYFYDEDPQPGRIAGTVIVTRASVGQPVTSHFNVYFGTATGEKLTDMPAMILEVPLAGRNVSQALPEGSALPDGARRLMAFAYSPGSEFETGRSIDLVDWAPPQVPPEGIRFDDEDPASGAIGGMIHVTRGSHDALRTGFNVYLSDVIGRKLQRMGNVSAGGSLPACSGRTCGSIEITAGGEGGDWRVARGREGYGRDEQATVTFEGPGVLTFSFFDTEPSYDIVTFLGSSYSGMSAPSPISVPAGSHELRWRSDASVERNGWVCFWSMQATGLAVPHGTTLPPHGITHLLAVSVGAGGEMSTGALTPIVDWAPPTIVPARVEFNDTDLGVGTIGGEMRVFRAAGDAAAGVSSYVVFWATSAGMMEGRDSIASVSVSAGSGSPAVLTVPAGTALVAGATHLQVLAQGANGYARSGAMVPIVDENGMMVDRTAIDEVLTLGAERTVNVVVTNANSEPVELRASLDFQQTSADIGPMSDIAGGDNASRTARAALPEEGRGSLPPKRPEVVKGRCLFSWSQSARSSHGRRLAERKLSGMFKIKAIKEFDKVGVSTIEAEDKEDSGRLCEHMSNDKENFEWAEPDFVLHAFDLAGLHAGPLFPQGKVESTVLPKNTHRSPQCTPETCSRAAAERGSVSTSSVAPQDPMLDQQWGLHHREDFDVNAMEAWQMHTGRSNDVIVAVIDSGVDYNHPDLVNQMWRNPGEIPRNGIDDDGNGFIDDVYGYDFAGDRGDPMDDNGHGTHCAGVISAETNNSIGISGVSWGAKIMALRFLAADGSGSTAGAIASVNYAVQMGAKISSNSWGGGGASVALNAAITAALNQGHLFIAAAGNAGQDVDAVPSYPCSYGQSNIICVAATDVYDQVASFSNYGARNVDIGAPGVQIMSTYPNNAYKYLSGTSMATPFVSGAAALLWDLVPQLPMEQVRSILLNTGRTSAALTGKTTTGKRLNVVAALQAVMSFSWLRIPEASRIVTIPGGGRATIPLQLGGPQVPSGEYNAFLRLQVESLQRRLPVHLAVHSYEASPAGGAQAVMFEDGDASLQGLGGVVTIMRASPEVENTISYYKLYWGTSETERMVPQPPGWPVILDVGAAFRDEFVDYDPSFWHPTPEVGRSFGVGFLRFHNATFGVANLRYVRQLTAPFFVRARVRASDDAFAAYAIQIGGSADAPPALMSANGGIQAAQVGRTKVIVGAGGMMSSAPCWPQSWVEIELRVDVDRVTLSDDQGCQNLTVDVNLQGPQQIVIGAYCTGSCQGSDWDYFEVSGGAYATYSIPPGLTHPENGSHILVVSGNALGEDVNGSVAVPVSDWYHPEAAQPPALVNASAPTTSSLKLDWSMPTLNECNFLAYQVWGLAAEEEEWFVPDGCASLVTVASTSCVATGLSSNTPHQFKVGVKCIRPEAESGFSEPSLIMVTSPVPAFAPSQVLTMLPSPDSFLIIWRTNSLNDCDFVESKVEAKAAGSTTWFQPQGCSQLMTLFSYMCTASGLQPATAYTVRVTTLCSVPAANSAPSEESSPIATLPTPATAAPASRLRVLRQNVNVDMEFGALRADATKKAALKSEVQERYAAKLGIDAKNVHVGLSEVSATALGSSKTRRLATARTKVEIYANAQESQLADAESFASLLITDAVQASTGETPSVFPETPSVFMPASAPQAVAARLVDPVAGNVNVTWQGRSVNQCDFLRYVVLATRGGDAATAFTPSGCETVYSLTAVSCLATGLTRGHDYTFTVSVLCANPATSSSVSVPSSKIFVGTPCTAPGGIANAAATACVEGATVASASACTPACQEGFRPSVSGLSCGDGALTPATFTCESVKADAATVPELLRADLTQGFTTIALAFRYAVYICASPPCADSPLSAPCGNVLEAGAVAALGQAPVCTWTEDRSTLMVKLGEGATIALGDNIAVRAGVLYSALPSSASETAAPALKTTLTKGSLSADFVIALTSSVEEASSCSDITVMAPVAPAGAYARQLRWTWGFGAQTPAVVAQALKPIFAAAKDSATLSISSLQLQPAASVFETERAAAEKGSPWMLEVTATATNWLGGTASSTSVMRITIAQLPPPEMMAISPMTTTIKRQETVELTVQTQGATIPACFLAMSGVVFSLPQVNVVWDYRESETGAWKSMSERGLVDKSPRPNIVRLPPFSFPPESSHWLRATAEYATGSVSRVNITFRVDVAARDAVVPLLDSPQKASSPCGFGLNASRSNDPAAGPGEAVSLVFAWACSSAEGDSTACRAKAENATGSTLQIAANELSAGTYNFTVRVRRSSDAAGLESIASRIVQVLGAALPPIQIVPVPWRSTGRVSEQSTSLGVVANIVVGGACPLPETWAWTWVLIDSSTKLIAYNMNATKSAGNGGLTAVSAGDFAMGTLKVGSTYYCQLLRADSSTKLASVLGSAPFPEDAVVAETIPFSVDAAPKDGVAVITPLQGEEVRTKFKVATGSWVDEEADRLRYAFYLFKLDPSTTLSLSNDMLTASPAFQMPALDWDDASSDKYWTKMGGLTLSGWSVANETPSAILPKGSFYVVARAKDASGGAGTSFVVGPLVSEASALSGAEVASALADTLASNDAEQILNSVSSLSGASVANAEEKKAKTQALLGAVGAAADMQERSNEGLQKSAMVMQTLVSDAGEALGLEDLKVASDIVGRSLDALVSEDSSEGLSKGAGDAILGSVMAMASSFSTNAGSQSGASAKDKAAMAESGHLALVAKVGKAAMKSLPAGVSKVLDSLDESGKGAVMNLRKEGLDKDIAADGLSMNATALQALASGGARRLADCGSISMQQTVWHKSNPYAGLLPAGVGAHDHVSAETDVNTIRFELCGSEYANPLTFNVDLKLPSKPTGFDDALHMLACVRYDSGTQSWAQSVAVDSVDTLSGVVKCRSTQGGGSYAAVYVPRQTASGDSATTTGLATTTTAGEEASTTNTSSTTFFIDQRRRPDAGARPGSALSHVPLLIVLLSAVSSIAMGA